MRKKEGLLSILDLGATRVCAAVAKQNEAGGLELLGMAVLPARGIRNGVIVDMEELSGVTGMVVAETEKTAQVRLSRAVVGIGSRELLSFNSSGSLSMGQSPQPVTAGNFQKCIEAARNISLSAPLEPLHCLVRQCLLDDKVEVDNPVGMSAKRLEVGIHILALPKSTITHTIKAVNQAGLNVEKLMLQSMAVADEVLINEEKEFGSVFIDLGASATTSLIYQKGKVQHSFAIPVGGDNFTKDIVVGLRTTIMEAERVKCRFGTLDRINADSSELLEIHGAGSGRPRQIVRQILMDIIQPRTDEILEMIRTEIGLAGFDLSQFSAIVLSGGGSMLGGLPAYVEKTFDVPCRPGQPVLPDGWPGEFCNPAGAVMLGLFQRASRLMEGGAKSGGEALARDQKGVNRTGRKIRNWIQDFFNMD